MTGITQKMRPQIALGAPERGPVRQGLSIEPLTVTRRMDELVKGGRVKLFRRREGFALRQVNLVGPRPVERPVATEPNGRWIRHPGNDGVAGCDGLVVVSQRCFYRMSVAESVDAWTFTLVHVDDAVGPDDECRAAAGGNLCRVGIDFPCLGGATLGNPGFPEVSTS